MPHDAERPGAAHSSSLIKALIRLFPQEDGANDLDDDAQTEDDTGKPRSTEEKQADRNDGTDGRKPVNGFHTLSLERGADGSRQAQLVIFYFCIE